eukprot:9198681-Alexandrium_andersonii.AAC.1
MGFNALELHRHSSRPCSNTPESGSELLVAIHDCHAGTWILLIASRTGSESLLCAVEAVLERLEQPYVFGHAQQLSCS